MDVRNQEIIDIQEDKDGNWYDANGNPISQNLRDHLIPIETTDVAGVKAMSKPKRKNWMRNKQCPCNSGRKFKNCCWRKYA